MAKPEKTTAEELVRLVEERITGSLDYGRGNNEFRRRCTSLLPINSLNLWPDQSRNLVALD